ncbi:hypothetical protein [Bradyrhizobium acaciae]|uniref:hypothetical protein n=1 Tax=Bradyrhizobium acaciae TaxID=2683706 RepID=UPI001E5C9154|nr:hypothetical protein [Bradyrhizobium acaciae]MCC8983489.1 hypothetical protein [Bradyrhizobium acaciae]
MIMISDFPLSRCTAKLDFGIQGKQGGEKVLRHSRLNLLDQQMPFWLSLGKKQLAVMSMHVAADDFKAERGFMVRSEGVRIWREFNSLPDWVQKLSAIRV